MKRVVVIALLTACWQSSRPPAQPVVENKPAPTAVRASAPLPTSETEQIMQAMEQFAERFCDCRDAPCAQAVSNEMTRWSQEMVGRGAEPPKLNDEEMNRMSDIAERMTKCMQNAMSGSPPTP